MKKEEERFNDVEECFNFDSKVNALEEAWNRGYEFCKKENGDLKQ